MRAHKRQLFDVDLNITDRCNLHCEFCSVYVTPISDKTAELTLDRIEKLFSEFERLGAQFVRLVGGEPFARRDIEAILKMTSNFSFSSSVLTNGTVMKEKHVDLLKQHGLDVAFSVDGHNAELHDRSRGQRGSYDRLLRIINYCIKVGVSHSMMTAVTRAVVPNMKELVVFAEKYRFELVNFILLGLGGSAIANRHHFPTYKSWSEAIVDLSLFIRDTKPDTPVSILFPHEDDVPIELYDPLKKANLLSLLKEVWSIDYRSFDRNRPHRSFCEAGHDSVSILPNGDVYGCDLMRDIPEFKAGNINEKSLAEIFYRSPVFKKLRRSPHVVPCGSLDDASTDFACGQCRAGKHNLTQSPVNIPVHISHTSRSLKSPSIAN